MRESEILHQGAEPVIRSTLAETSSSEHRTSQATGLLTPDALVFRVQESPVEGGVVCNEVGIAGELREALHHDFAGIGIREHRVADAGVVLDERADGDAEGLV